MRNFSCVENVSYVRIGCNGNVKYYCSSLICKLGIGSYVGVCKGMWGWRRKLLFLNKIPITRVDA